jgi:hypothetical protein
VRQRFLTATAPLKKYYFIKHVVTMHPAAGMVDAVYCISVDK